MTHAIAIMTQASNMYPEAEAEDDKVVGITATGGVPPPPLALSRIPPALLFAGHTVGSSAREKKASAPGPAISTPRGGTTRSVPIGSCALRPVAVACVGGDTDATGRELASTQRPSVTLMSSKNTYWSDDGMYRSSDPPWKLSHCSRGNSLKKQDFSHVRFSVLSESTRLTPGSCMTQFDARVWGHLNLCNHFAAHCHVTKSAEVGCCSPGLSHLQLCNSMAWNAPVKYFVAGIDQLGDCISTIFLNPNFVQTITLTCKLQKSNCLKFEYQILTPCRAALASKPTELSGVKLSSRYLCLTPRCTSPQQFIVFTRRLVRRTRSVQLEVHEHGVPSVSHCSHRVRPILTVDALALQGSDVHVCHKLTCTKCSLVRNRCWCASFKGHTLIPEL